ncbi:hypothetical protein SAMN05192532_102447 [Alteribacillus iranensis]|uniref:Uncharacterized protein n=1 Tax=Alteribacillus iranensis TaxID=930128 RepID=A0A1I2BQK4_9BACI|nr:hypothetical protein SAMN05192532_102447 [Alteribacillus iranensis]
MNEWKQNVRQTDFHPATRKYYLSFKKVILSLLHSIEGG